jgi:hypothetical protein
LANEIKIGFDRTEEDKRAIIALLNKTAAFDDEKNKLDFINNVDNKEYKEIFMQRAVAIAVQENDTRIIAELIKLADYKDILKSEIKRSLVLMLKRDDNDYKESLFEKLFKDKLNIKTGPEYLAKIFETKEAKFDYYDKQDFVVFTNKAASIEGIKVPKKFQLHEIMIKNINNNNKFKNTSIKYKCLKLN